MRKFNEIIISLPHCIYISFDVNTDNDSWEIRNLILWEVFNCNDGVGRLTLLNFTNFNCIYTTILSERKLCILNHVMEIELITKSISLPKACHATNFSTYPKVIPSQLLNRDCLRLFAPKKGDEQRHRPRTCKRSSSGPNPKLPPMIYIWYAFRFCTSIQFSYKLSSEDI